MGDIRRPEDARRIRRGHSHDVTPLQPSKPVSPTSFENLVKEIDLLRAEIIKIKMMLRDHGISIS